MKKAQNKQETSDSQTPPEEKKRPSNAPPKATARISDLAEITNPTDEMVASLADQLCAIVADDYDIRVRLDSDFENLQLQKLTVLINSLLENVRRNIGTLSELAEDLESKVRERTLELDLVVQGSNDGVWLWNVEKNVVDYSKRWRDLLGLEGEELDTIESWLSRVHPDDQEKLRAALREHLQGVKPYLREDYRIRHADGTFRWMWCRGRCHRDENGRATFMAGTQTDVHTFRSIDPSTGLPNETALMASLRDLISDGVSFRAALIGIPRVDSMKEDMDSDELSMLRRAVACRISSNLPFGADLFHLSGDYYAAIIPERIQKRFLEQEVVSPLLSAFNKPFETSRHRAWLDISLGFTMPISNKSASPSDTMRDAWTSYRAARKQRTTFNVLSDHQLEGARDRAYIEQQIRIGLERDWFVPFFQPIVDIKTSEILGFETLCRMSHPEQGVIAPGRFIPVAEDIGVIDRISFLMFEKAISMLGSWAKLGAPFDKLFLTVNLESYQIMQPELPDLLKSAIAEKGFQPNLLKIEIVESSVIGNFDTAARQIAAIRNLGVQIALDDFGTGYSSLEYLNELSFDLIKIDRAFVDELDSDPRKRSMVKMMCVLAETLDAEVCVEGIETEAQAAVARELNAIFGQGYLYSKPVSEKDIVELIGTQQLQSKRAS